MLSHQSSVKLDRGCSYSCSDIAARFTDSPREDHLHLPSLQTQTLPPIKKPIPTSASKTTSQRVQTATSVPLPTSPPLKQAKQPGLRTAGVHNPIKGEDQTNTGSEPRSPLNRAADSSHSTTTLILPSARPLHLQQSQEHPSSQTQDCEGLIIPSLAPPYPVTQNVIQSTQSSACDRVPHNRSRMALSQPQPFPSSISSSDHTSTMTLGTDGPYSMMTMDTGSELLHVPLDMQAASKVADDKRKRNATASLRFRQRRKEKERETTKKFSELEQKIRKLEEERDYYRDIAARTSGQAPLLPQTLSLEQMRLEFLNAPIGQSSARSQDSDRNDGRNANAYAPPRGSHAFPKLQVNARASDPRTESLVANSSTSSCCGLRARP